MNAISNFLIKVLIAGLLSVSSNLLTAATMHKSVIVKNDTSTYMKIEGTIVAENKEVKGNYLIEVIYFDSVIGSYQVKDNKPVAFNLKKNSAYTLKISKKGFIARYICINTSVSNNENITPLYSFYLETEFIQVAEAMRMDDEALKLPIAMIKYDARRGNFTNNNGYSIFVRQKLYAGNNDLGLLSVKN